MRDFEIIQPENELGGLLLVFCCFSFEIDCSVTPISIWILSYQLRVIAFAQILLICNLICLSKHGFCLWDTLQSENMYHLIGLWVQTFIGTITTKLYISTLNHVNHGKDINYIFPALNRNIGLYYLVEVFVAIYLNLLSTFLSLDKINESIRLFSYKYILLLVSFHFTALQKAQIIITNLIYGINVLVILFTFTAQ